MAENKENNKKKAGRRKGVPNKVTSFTKAIINNILTDYYSSGLMQQDLKALQPKERVQTMVKLAEFNIPKPQSVAIQVEEAKKKTIEDKLGELARKMG